MTTFITIENEIKALEGVKVENIDQFTDSYLGIEGVIPTLYKQIVSKEKGPNSSDCLRKLMELRIKFKEILSNYRRNCE